MVRLGQSEPALSALLRIRYGDGLKIAKSAASYGVTVWMTPWGTGTNGATGGTYTTTQTNPNGCTCSMPVLWDRRGSCREQQHECNESVGAHNGCRAVHDDPLCHFIERQLGFQVCRHGEWVALYVLAWEPKRDDVRRQTLG